MTTTGPAALTGKLVYNLTTDTSTSATASTTTYVLTLNNASPVACALPALSGLSGKPIRIKNLGAGVVTVSANGAETIFTTSAVASFQLLTGEAVDLTATAAYWIAQ